VTPAARAGITPWRALCGVLLLLAGESAAPDRASGETEPARRLRQTIPILGVSGDDRSGVVFYVTVQVEKRQDGGGLISRTTGTGGAFSPAAQQAVEQGIERAFRALGLNPASWTVTLSHPYPGVTVSGDSLGAMVGVSAAALAQGIAIPAGLAMTGTVTPEGAIGSVGALRAKLAAAGAAKLQTVLIPQGALQDGPQPAHPRPAFVAVQTVQEAFEKLRAPGREPAAPKD
jgi:predicted S18 family serine protease